VLVLLGEDEGYWPVLERTLEHAKISGPKVHDARIAALCLHHGVKELCSADRDFKHFPKLSVRNPLRNEKD
jgi:predicted nucleic acid-binding protein